MLREFAPAKINLYLHITGRRPDGYHILDSLVAFAGVGDEIIIEPAPRFDFILEGPQAAALKNEKPENNLAVRAAKALAEKLGKKLDLRLTLIKNLPVASGIGGGSSDAAATLRALAVHWNLAPNDPVLAEIAALCGQDVLVCLKPDNCYITADGAAPAPDLPHANILLINPNKGLATADVYKSFKESGTGFSKIARLNAAPADLAAFVSELQTRPNDLTAPAIKRLPVIEKIIGDLATATEQCLLARMSGSGATCFALYPDRDSARKAAFTMLNAHPEWWVAQTHIPIRRDRRQRA